MSIQWPEKKREIHTHHFDSTIWNDFIFRDDDIIVASYGKSGTTWTQQILAQLILNGDPDVAVAEKSPWMDLRVPPKEVKLPAVEAITHRRFLKTHLPVDALVFNPKVKYLYVARDARDVVWSFHNHHFNANQLWFDTLNNAPGLVGPELAPACSDISQYWHDWMDKDGFPFWSFWENTRSWWEIRNLPNVKFVHFSDLKKNMPAEIRSIATFLDISIDESKWEDIVKHCTFDWMKANGSKSCPVGGAFWDGGSKVFINKGVNDRWRDVLTAEDCEEYEAKAVRELGPECAQWLLTGGSLPPFHSRIMASDVVAGAVKQGLENSCHI